MTYLIIPVYFRLKYAYHIIFLKPTIAHKLSYQGGAPCNLQYKTNDFVAKIQFMLNMGYTIDIQNSGILNFLSNENMKNISIIISNLFTLYRGMDSCEDISCLYMWPIYYLDVRSMAYNFEIHQKFKVLCEISATLAFSEIICA